MSTASSTSHVTPVTTGGQHGSTAPEATGQEAPTTAIPLADLVRETATPAPALTRPTASYEGQHWRLLAQRRSYQALPSPDVARHRAQQMGEDFDPSATESTAVICIRVHHPDGRVLNLTADASSSDTNAHTPVNRAFTQHLGYLLRARRGADRESASLAALSRVFEAGWALVHGTADLAGLAPAAFVQAAAHDIDPQAVATWLDSAQRLFGAPEHARYVTVSQVAMMLNAGMSADKAHAWFGNAHISALISLAREEVVRAMAFLDAGWTRAQEQKVSAAAARFAADREVHEVLGAQYAQPLSAQWAPLGPKQALLACSAGLDAAEALRLRESGQWDEKGLRVLAALNASAASPAQG